MAAESILTYKRPGFPVTSNTESSYVTSIEYVGPESTLAAAEPAANSAWGDYSGLVKSTRLEPIEGTTQAILRVETEYFYEAGSTAGTAREVEIEIEWVSFQRSLYEHPQFRLGGGGANALDSTDIAAIKAWEEEQDVTTKASYAYTNPATGLPVDLSADAELFARGIELGQETYEDYAPVARKITRYTGGPPGSTSAGAKETPTGITGLPSGYEWRKSADRSIRAGGQTRWERTEEWTAAIKVLSDKSTIYWS